MVGFTDTRLGRYLVLDVKAGLVSYCWATSLGRGEKKPESITARRSQGTVIQASSSKGEFISSMVSPSWVFARGCYTL
jgi:hypothetical protein